MDQANEMSLDGAGGRFGRRSAVKRLLAARTVGVVLVAPFVILITRARLATWSATSDQAAIEVRTREVGSSHTPLIGPYSRFGWSHPGPALFYALAVPYRLFSSHSNGLLAGAAVIGAVAVLVAAFAILSIRMTRGKTYWAFVIVVVLVRALGATFLWDVWNPYMVVLPFLAFVALIWLASTGDARALPIAVVFGSFIAQTHVSVAPEVVGLLVLACLWLICSRDARERRDLRPSLIVALAVAVIMWLPPIIQQLQPSGGNLSDIWRFWTASHPSLGYSRAWRLLAPEFSVPAPWISGHDYKATLNGAAVAPRFSFPYALVALLVGAVVAWRRRDRVALIFCSVAGSAALLALASMARIVGEPYPYLFRWTWVVAATTWVALGVTLLPVLAARFGHLATTVSSNALPAATLTVLAAVVVSAFTAPPVASADSDVVRTLIIQSLPTLRQQHGPILILPKDYSFEELKLMDGLVAAMKEHGLDGRWPPPFAYLAGTQETVRQDRARSILLLATGSQIASIRAHDPRYHQIASDTTSKGTAALLIAASATR